MNPAPTHTPAAPKAGLPAREAAPRSGPGGEQGSERSILPASGSLCSARSAAPHRRSALAPGSSSEAPGVGVAVGVATCPWEFPNTQSARPSSPGWQSSPDRGPQATGPARGKPAPEPGVGRQIGCPSASLRNVHLSPRPSSLLRGPQLVPGTKTTTRFVCW